MIARMPRVVELRLIDLRIVWLTAVMLSVGGCALRPTVPGTSVPWAERRARLVALSTWQASGRIAVKSDAGGGQGSVRWQQAETRSVVRVSGPFGAGAYEIAWDRDAVEIIGRAGDAQLAYAGPNAAEKFLHAQLGWSFPAMSLRYWILGVPDPGHKSRERFDDNGWLAGIEQDGWSIAYDDFEIRNEIWLPRKVVLNNDQARVRLIVDEWEL